MNRIALLLLPLFLTACANGAFRTESSLRQEYGTIMDEMVGKDKSQVASVLGKPSEIKQMPGGGEELLFYASTYRMDQLAFVTLPSQARNDCVTSMKTDLEGKIASYNVTGENCGIAFMNKVYKVRDQSK